MRLYSVILTTGKRTRDGQKERIRSWKDHGDQRKAHQGARRPDKTDRHGRASFSYQTDKHPHIQSECRTVEQKDEQPGSTKSQRHSGKKEAGRRGGDRREARWGEFYYCGTEVTVVIYPL